MSIVQRFVFENSDEILNLKVTVRNDPSWVKVKISHPQVIKRAKFYGIDGEPLEFELNIFPRLTSLGSLRMIQEYSHHRNIGSKKFGDRLIFRSMFNDIDWNKKNYEEECISDPENRKLC